MTVPTLNQLLNPTKRTNKVCNQCGDKFKYDKISVPKNNLFIFIGFDHHQPEPLITDWPLLLHVTDFISYTKDSPPLTVPYELAYIQYRKDGDGSENSIGHSTCIFYFINKYYYYNDMANEGKIRLITD